MGQREGKSGFEFKVAFPWVGIAALALGACALMVDRSDNTPSQTLDEFTAAHLTARSLADLFPGSH